MLRKIALLVVLSACLFIVGCSQKENVVKAVESPGVENVSKSMSGYPKTYTYSNGKLLDHSRVILEDLNLTYSFVNYSSSNYFVIVRGNGISETVRSKTITLSSKDLFQEKSVKLYFYGPSSFKINVDANSNLIGNLITGYCTEGVSRIKTSTNQLPWTIIGQSDAGRWYDLAKNAGFLVGDTPKVGAIVVLTGGSYSSYGHVGIVTGISGSDFMMKSMNNGIKNLGDGKTELFGVYNTVTIKSTNTATKKYIYYKLDKY